MRHVIRSSIACLMVLAGLTLPPLVEPQPATAADATVSTCDWETLSQELDAVQAGGGGTISFDCSGTIFFDERLEITSDVTIIGNGDVVFDGQDSTQLIDVGNGASLGLINLTLQNGSDTLGGAINNRFSSVTIIASTFSNNNAGSGGAIANTGSLTIIASTFSENSGTGGAIRHLSGTLEISASSFFDNLSFDTGGAIDMLATARIVTSTFSDNGAFDDGGAIYSDGALEVIASTFSDNAAGHFGGAIRHITDPLEITASTFSDNSADSGGVIYATSNVTVQSSILANSGAGGNCVAGSLTSLGYNLSDDISCGFNETSDQQGTGVTVTLGDLQDNGGPTHTMLPESTNAIDTILFADCLDFSSEQDQRGVDRPRDDGCERGSVELGPVPVQILAAYNLGPTPEGQSTEVVAVAFGPAATPLTYAFDCDDDGVYEITGNDPSASCTFDDDGLYLVSIEVCDSTDPQNCDTTSTEVTVTNVAPTIEDITTMVDGDQITVTLTASDPGDDALSYRFDCDTDGIFELENGTDPVGVCPVTGLGTLQQIGVQVSDGDGGVTTALTEQVAITYELCLNRVTGEVSEPSGDGCGRYALVITLPDDGPLTFCASRVTGQLSVAVLGECSRVEQALVLPDDGPVTVCVHRVTGLMRLAGGDGCSRYEAARVVGGMPVGPPP